jgi:plasmid maintenance system antidote protein VapI
MTTEVKIKIQQLLQKYCSNYVSQSKAAKSLNGVSGGTISQALNNNWELISDKMWLNIGKQIGYKSDLWVIANTDNQETMHDLLLDARDNARVHALIGRASWGKDTGIKDFRDTYQNVFQVNCSDLHTIKHLIAELLRSMGEKPVGTAYQMFSQLHQAIIKYETPTIVINEYEKLLPPAFKFFITLFNFLEGKAGIVVTGTPYLRDRIEGGLNRKAGYDEIYSRLGSKFIELVRPSKKDVRAICNANGIENATNIDDIYKEFKADYDLRRVKKLAQNVVLDNAISQ